jgi:hypothetical protein
LSGDKLSRALGSGTTGSARSLDSGSSARSPESCAQRVSDTFAATAEGPSPWSCIRSNSTNGDRHLGAIFAAAISSRLRVAGLLVHPRRSTDPARPNARCPRHERALRRSVRRVVDLARAQRRAVTRRFRPIMRTASPTRRAVKTAESAPCFNPNPIRSASVKATTAPTTACVVVLAGPKMRWRVSDEAFKSAHRPCPVNGGARYAFI